MSIKAKIKSQKKQQLKNVVRGIKSIADRNDTNEVFNKNVRNFLKKTNTSFEAAVKAAKKKK